MRKVCGIYRITSPTGKVYIGQSRNIFHRMYNYKNGHVNRQPGIYSSIKKYGWDAHAHEAIHRLPNDVTQKVLDDYEAVYMDAYKSCGVYLLNVKEAGYRGELSAESRRKISEGNKGKKASEAWIIRMREFMTGKRYALGYRHTDETKKKIGARSHRGRHPSAVKVVSINTGTVYGCIRDAAEAYGIKAATLVNKLSGHRSNNTDLRYA